VGKLLLTTSAAVLGVLGVTCLFAPGEVLGQLGEVSLAPPCLVVQLLGAALIGFGLLDWVSRHSPLGGIYARPLAAGNLIHFGAGSLVLAKGVVSHPRNFIAGWAALTVYALFATGFAVVLFIRRPDAH
jgi:hypothetical protein